MDDNESWSGETEVDDDDESWSGETELENEDEESTMTTSSHSCTASNKKGKPLKTPKKNKITKLNIVRTDERGKKIRIAEEPSVSVAEDVLEGSRNLFHLAYNGKSPKIDEEAETRNFTNRYHSDENNDEKPHRCVDCNMVFKSYQALGGHTAHCRRRSMNNDLAHG